MSDAIFSKINALAAAVLVASYVSIALIDLAG